MRQRIAVIYNEPLPSRYDKAGEAGAVLGVLESVVAVRRSLTELGAEVTCLPLKPPLERARWKLGSLDADLVFNLFEGFCGEPASEALVPQYVESSGLPFTGCPAAAIELGLDKARAKAVLQAAGIPTPGFQLLNTETARSCSIGFPCIVKPCCEDASHGISADSVVRDMSSLENQLKRLKDSYGDVLVEEFIEGREFNATVLGNSEYSVLPVSEILYALPPDMPEILTFASKWVPESDYYRGTKVACPADIDNGTRRLIADTAGAACRSLGCRGYARVDMRMDKSGRLFVIEVNPNPDISPEAGAARQARAAGMTYTGMIAKIINLALEKDKYVGTDSPHAAGGQAGPDGPAERHPRVQTV